jgi:hypothetical protein
MRSGALAVVMWPQEQDTVSRWKTRLRKNGCTYSQTTDGLLPAGRRGPLHLGQSLSVTGTGVTSVSTVASRRAAFRFLVCRASSGVRLTLGSGGGSLLLGRRSLFFSKRRRSSAASFSVNSTSFCSCAAAYAFQPQS